MSQKCSVSRFSGVVKRASHTSYIRCATVHLFPQVNRVALKILPVIQTEPTSQQDTARSRYRW